MKTRPYAVLAILAVAAGAFIAFKPNAQSRLPVYPTYQLGGAWIGSGGGIIWNAFQIPLDPAGRTAAIRVNSFTYGADFAGLLATFGADTLSEFTTQAEMISRDTAKYSFVGYGTKQGNPPLINLIFVMRGTLTFTGSASMVVNYTMDAYPAAADEDGDGFPDPGTTPVVSIPGTGSAKRVLP